jgi:hypothetical protein
MLALGAQQRLLQPLDQIRIGGALDYGVSVIADFVGMELNVGVRQHLDPPEALCRAVEDQLCALALGLG